MKYLCRIIIAAAMVMLTGCSKPEQIGGPYMLFEIHGTVMDEAGNPIEGIEVSAGQSDIVKTNVNGRFSFHGRSAPMTYAILTFEDKDGEENGGEFLKSDRNIPIAEKIPGDKNGNFKGKFFAQNVEIILILKTSSIDPDSGNLDVNPEIPTVQ